MSHPIIRRHFRLPVQFSLFLCSSVCHSTVITRTWNLTLHHSSSFKYSLKNLKVYISVLYKWSVRLLVCTQWDDERRAASAQHSWAQPPPGWKLPDLLPVPAGDAAVQTTEPWQGTALWLCPASHVSDVPTQYGNMCYWISHFQVLISMEKYFSFQTTAPFLFSKILNSELKRSHKRCVFIQPCELPLRLYITSCKTALPHI